MAAVATLTTGVGEVASGGVGEHQGAADLPVVVSGSPTVTGPAVGTPGSTVTVTVSVVVRTPLSAVMDGEGVGGGGVGDGLALQVGGGVGERPVAGSMVTAAPPVLAARPL